MKPLKEECCVECRELNPFFRLSGGVVGKFAYTRETPYIQPFETIESPWADFIKSDSMETNIKKLFKLAQKYSKSQKQEAKEEKPKEQEKPKEEEKPKEQEKPDQEKSNGKSADKEEEESPRLSRTEYNRLKSRWISVAQFAPLSPQQKQTILSIARGHSEIRTTKGQFFKQVDENLFNKLNEKFETRYPWIKKGKN